MTYEQLITKLRERMTKAGGVRAYAREIGVSPTYISGVMNGRVTTPGHKFLKLAGYEVIHKTRIQRVPVATGEISYRRMKKPEA